MRTIVVSCCFALSSFAANAAPVQSYPTKPIRLIVGFAAGGGVDLSARIVGAKLNEIWGQQVVVDNRPGAASTIAADLAAKAAADGYTLLLCQVASHAIAPSLYRKLGYDHIKDFVPVSQIVTTTNVLVVNLGVPAKSVKEFIAHARANAGKVIFASPGVGSSPNLTMELMRSTTGINIVHVAYKGGAPALAELLGGHVHAMFDNLSTQLPTIKAGRVRALAVTSPKRSKYLPDTMTMIESGFPIEVAPWYGICAPSGIPKSILAKIHADVVKALGAAEVGRRLAEQALDVAPSTPEQFAALIKAETTKWAKVIKDAGIQPQ